MVDPTPETLRLVAAVFARAARHVEPVMERVGIGWATRRAYEDLEDLIPQDVREIVCERANLVFYAYDGSPRDLRARLVAEAERALAEVARGQEPREGRRA